MSAPPVPKPRHRPNDPAQASKGHPLPPPRRSSLENRVKPPAILQARGIRQEKRPTNTLLAPSPDLPVPRRSRSPSPQPRAKPTAAPKPQPRLRVSPGSKAKPVRPGAKPTLAPKPTLPTKPSGLRGKPPPPRKAPPRANVAKPKPAPPPTSTPTPTSAATPTTQTSSNNDTASPKPMARPNPTTSVPLAGDSTSTRPTRPRRPPPGKLATLSRGDVGAMLRKFETNEEAIAEDNSQSEARAPPVQENTSGKSTVEHTQLVALSDNDHTPNNGAGAVALDQPSPVPEGTATLSSGSSTPSDGRSPASARRRRRAQKFRYKDPTIEQQEEEQQQLQDTRRPHVPQEPPAGPITTGAGADVQEASYEEVQSVQTVIDSALQQSHSPVQDPSQSEEYTQDVDAHHGMETAAVRAANEDERPLSESSDRESDPSDVSTAHLQDTQEEEVAVPQTFQPLPKEERDPVEYLVHKRRGLRRTKRRPPPPPGTFNISQPMQDPSTAEVNADGVVAVAMSDSSFDQSIIVSEDEISDSTSSSSDEEEIAGEPEREMTKREKVVREILSTETTYVDSLKVLQEVFVEALLKGEKNKPVLNTAVMDTIFSNSRELLNLHLNLLSQLQETVDNWAEKDAVGDVFVRNAPFLKMYTVYTTNFDRANQTMAEWRKRSTQFEAVLKKCQAMERCNGLNLGAFLLEPVQRIPRYKLLLQEYIKRTDEDHPDHGVACAALEKVADVARHVNESIRAQEQSIKMLQIQQMVPGIDIVTPGRVFVKQGTLQKMCRKGLQPRMILLFSDILIYAREQSTLTTQYVSAHVLKLHQVKVPSEKFMVPGIDNVIRILSSTEKSFMLSAASEAEQSSWIEILNTTIEGHMKSRSTLSATEGEGETHPDMCGAFGEVAPVWIPDAGVSMCMNCTAEFNFMRRRHHCRGCGKVLCGACSAQAAPLRYLQKEGRVCVDCYDAISAASAPDPESKVSQKKINRQSTKREKATKRARSLRDKAAFKSANTLLEAANGISTEGRKDIVMSGYMTQKAAKLKVSKRRYWVLKTNFVLYSYKAPEDIVALSSIPLPGYTVEQVKADGDKDLVFKLVHPGVRSYTYSVEEREAYLRWVECCSAAGMLREVDYEVRDEDGDWAFVTIHEEDEPAEEPEHEEDGERIVEEPAANAQGGEYMAIGDHQEVSIEGTTGAETLA